MWLGLVPYSTDQMRFGYRLACVGLGFLGIMFVFYLELESTGIFEFRSFSPNVNRKNRKNYYRSERPSNPTASQTEQTGKRNSSLERTGYFREVAKDTYVYSVFYDDRESRPCIRLIVLSGKYYQPELFCHFCSSFATNCNVPVKQATYYTPNENHGRVFGGFIASCDVPEQIDGAPSFIDVTAEVKGQKTRKVRLPVVSTKMETKRHNYTVCVPPLIGDKLTVQRLVEFVELTRLLGATHFTFYEFQADQELKRALEYYQQLELVDILPWNLPASLASNPHHVWNFGQVLAILDCLFRSVKSAKFVAFNDIDEFIVPLQHNTLPDLLNAIHTQNHCGHCFNSVVFSLNARFPHAGKRSKLYSQKYSHRTKEMISSLSKCVVDPRRVFEMGIHHISKTYNERFTDNIVNESLGLVFHYRTCSVSYGIRHQCNDLRPDFTMHKFGNILQVLFDETMKALNISNDTNGIGDGQT